MKWNEILKSLREDNDITQKDMADTLGVDPKTLQRYERGVNEPTISILKKYSDKFSVSIDYLCGHDKTTKQDDTDTKIKLEEIMDTIGDILKKM